MSTKSFLPKQEDRAYGFFGYRGHMCDLAIKADNAEMLSECIDRDFCDADSLMMGGGTVLQHCEKVAPKCSAMLKARPA